MDPRREAAREVMRGMIKGTQLRGTGQLAPGGTQDYTASPGNGIGTHSPC